MDVSPNSQGPTKRPRAKSVAKKSAANDVATKPARKSLTASRKKRVEASPKILEMTPELPADLNDMIAIAAFYLASERSFAPGRELDDWLEAEARIRALHTA